jgi:hypothetical protein
MYIDSATISVDRNIYTQLNFFENLQSFTKWERISRSGAKEHSQNTPFRKIYVTLAI